MVQYSLDVSIVTITLNDSTTIQATIDSVASQEYDNMEYVIKDGGSTDGTVGVVEENHEVINEWTSTPDDGLFDALNHAIKMTTGDVVGMLHADDLFQDEQVISDVVEALATNDADVCWGDLLYVDRDDPDEIARYWESSEYCPGKFARGWMPPHLTFFAKRKLFEKYGYYDPSLRMAADYELMMRFLKIYGVKGTYVPRVLVKMRTGGVSDRSIRNLKQIVVNQWDCYRSWRANGLSGGFLVPVLKPLWKLPQSFKTPPSQKS